MNRITVIILLLIFNTPSLFSQQGLSKDQSSTFILNLSPAAKIFLSDKTAHAKKILFLLQFDKKNSCAWKEKLKHFSRDCTFYGDAFASLRISYNELKKIIDCPDALIAIDIASALPKEELATPGFDLSANKINMLHDRFPLINGDGMVVSVKENLFDTNDIDIKGRILPSSIASATTTNHASFMATLIAGAGNSVYYGKGAAWGAAVSSSSFQSLLPDAGTYYRPNNITVQNNSYGTVIDNNYGVSSAAFDISSNQETNLLQVFSAGNVGQTASSAGTYTGITGWANLSGNIKQTKNSLIVGEADSFGVVTAPSSRGPAYDGRIKPDLVAFGKDGSSESAAIASGTALDLQHLYKSTHAGNLPSSALIKAVMLNGANDIGLPGPDYTSGFGNLDALRSAGIINDNKLISGTISQGNIQNHSFTLPANVSQLKVTLVWNDTAAVANASKAVVNDLDLELLLPAASQSWKPWVLNPFPHVDSLSKAAVRKRDSLNNAEQVTVDNPAAGNYTIRITGYNVPFANQSYSIAYNWDTLNSFEWQHPAKADVMLAVKQNILRWETNISGTGTAEYSINNGSSWISISNATDLSKKYIRWDAPDTLSRCLLRMKIGSNFYYSDTFLLSKLIIPKVGFDCNDSLLLFWNKVNGAAKYKVYQLGAKYMQPLIDVSDTSVLLSKSAISSTYFSIAPVLANGTLMANGNAVNYTQQGTGCFVQSFLADRNGINAADLKLQLGTAYKVSTVIFEKYFSNGPQTVYTVAANGSLFYNSTYAPLTKGINLFRAKLILADGTVVYSNWAELINADDSGYILLPNPVQRAAGFQLLTAVPGGETFQLFDMAGKKVMERNISLVKEDYNTSALQAGIYFYRISKQGKKLMSGKLVIL